MTLRHMRDLIRDLSPEWLRGDVWYPVLYTVGLQLDTMLDAAAAAIEHRIPNLRSDESLPLLGRDRRMPRGLLESDATYGRRLRRYIDSNKRRGGPHELLVQLRAFHDPAPADIQVIYRSGRRFTIDGSGTITMDDVTGWGPDATPELWASYTVLLTTDLYHALSASERTKALNDLRSLVAAYNAAHCLVTVVVLATTSELWDGLPPDTWDTGTTWDAVGAPAPYYLTIP